MLKTIISLLMSIAMLSLSHEALAQWSYVFTSRPGATGSNVHISRFNPNMFVVVQAINGAAVAYYSYDAGVTWDSTPPCPGGLAEAFGGIHCPTDTSCFVFIGGTNTTLRSAKVNLQTGTWSKFTYNNWSPNSPWCTGDDTCFTYAQLPLGGGDLIVKSYNGFLNRLPPPPVDTIIGMGVASYNGQNLFFISDSVGYGIGTIYSNNSLNLKAGILKTTDAGQSWELIWSSQGNGGVTSIDFLNHNQGIQSTGNSLHLTNDGGQTWSTITPPSQLFTPTGAATYLRSSFRLSEDTLFAASWLYLYQSNDGGQTWLRDSILNSTFSYKMLVSADGTVYTSGPRYLNKRSGLLTGVSQRQMNPTVITYPNPVQNELQIESCDGCQYQIISSMGTTVLQGVLAGESISIGFLPSGVYHILLNSQAKSQTIKIIKE